jgi:hypothetical protein
METSFARIGSVLIAPLVYLFQDAERALHLGQQIDSPRVSAQQKYGRLTCRCRNALCLRFARESGDNYEIVLFSLQKSLASGRVADCALYPGMLEDGAPSLQAI